MKVALISPYPDIANYGLRTLSSVLRKNGHETQMLFMPDFAGDGENVHMAKPEDRYAPEIIDQMIEVVADADLVGITLMTHYFDSAKQLTREIRERLGKPIIWGGFHPSVRPDECIKHADYVAIGDAEDLIVKLAERIEKNDLEDLSEINGLVWHKGDGTIQRNKPGELEQELDYYPPPDFSRDEHHIVFEGQLMPVTKDLLQRYLHNGTVSRMFGKIGYQTMTGRGCPHACTYCGNSFTRDLYKGQRYVRYRSVEHVIEELVWIKEEYPFINFFWFSDDSFFGRPLPDMLKFCKLYKEKIGDPFYLLGSPGTITEEKYAPLVDAGLYCIQMGVEHGSKRIQKIFKRSTMGNDKIIRSAEIITKYHTENTMPPQYDVIYDLPYETLEDKLDTLRLIAQLPKPYKLQAFSVIFYPGTSLHTLASRDGLISDERDEIYDKWFFERHDSYANTLLFLAQSGHFPHPLLKVLTDSRVARVMTSETMAPLGDVAKGAIGVARKIFNNPLVDKLSGVGELSARMEGMTGANAGAAKPTLAGMTFGA